MKKSDVFHQPTYFDTYIDQVPDIHLSEAFHQSMAAIDALDLEQLHAIGDQVDAPGKWTLRDLFQHLLDGERIFAYRALRFARHRLLFQSFDETALRRIGVMFNSELPVLAIGFTIIGHQIHHFRIMEERYFTMLNTLV